MKNALLITSLLTCSSSLLAQTYELPHNIKFDIAGYLGWRQIISDVEYDTIPSQPEIGITTSLRLTSQLNIFNQFKYGVNINDILVYNQISYTPDINIDDFDLTLKVGKIRYDNTLYNITRINPRTRQGVFQPQSIYASTLAQAITSGAGVGFDMKYKLWSASYVIDKQTIVNPRNESQAWSTSRFNHMTSKFGDHQTVSMQYEIPDYGLRFKTSWNKSKFHVSEPIMPNPVLAITNTIGLEYITDGIEWRYNKWTVAFENQITKRDGVGWSQTNKLAYGYSGTIEYELNKNFILRGNYNQYNSSVKNIPANLQYNKDLNAGINWHHDSWMANVEAHWIRGARIVDIYNYNNNPNDYNSFYVIGTNLVYFFD